MEADRYQKNHKLFILGIFSLLIALSLFAFSLYLLPNLLFGWRYDTPEFIMFWKEWLLSQYDYTEPVAARLIFLFFFGIAFIFGVIAYFSSNRIDNQILSKELKVPEEEESPDKTTQNTREGLSLGLRILFIILIIFIIGTLFQWAIYNV